MTDDTPKDDKWRGFVNITLDESDKAAVKKQVFDAAAAFHYLVSLISEGYKVTLSQDRKNQDAILISATGREANQGLTMTQRHALPEVAVTAHYYAHVVKTNQEWPFEDDEEAWTW